MKAVDILKKVAEIVGVELSTNGSKQYAKLADGGVVSANAFENGNVVLQGDGPSALADGEYEVSVDGENGAKLYKLVINSGMISQFELLPKKGEQKMSEETVETKTLEQVNKELELENIEEPKDPMKEEKKEEEKMSVEDMVSALEARIKAIEDYMKADEAEVEVVAEKKEEKMSKQKKFNAAPVEEKKANPILTNANKSRSTIDSVWEKMGNFK